MDELGCVGPSDGTIEVSVFGPGYGESVAVHLGRGDWMIVDSCRDASTQRPAAIDYLERIGVDPERQVRLVVASHWHDDHVRGIADTVARCHAARFACAAALTADEFLTLVEATSTPAMEHPLTSGVAELRRVLDTLAARAVDTAGQGPMLATVDRVLWTRPAQDQAGLECEVAALSPSDAAHRRALGAIARLIPAPGTPKRRVAAPEQNDVALALHIRIGTQSLILGSDLEEHGAAGGGWSVIAASPIPRARAVVFKIPHHGSETADHEPSWRQLLAASPVAAATPFIRGNVQLPTADDCTRICGRTPNAYISAPVRRPKDRWRAGAVARTVHETVRWIAPVPRVPGQVRMRFCTDVAGAEGWGTELFRGARRLADAHA